MENWSVPEDDRPYIRPARSFNPWLAVAAIGALAWALAFYFRTWTEPAPPAPPPSAPALEAPAPPPAEPAIRHPLEVSNDAPAALPSLENSDSMLRDSVSRLIGGKAFADMVVPYQLVRRIVATVDNLPRRTAPTRVMPLNAVPGAFAAVTNGEQTVVDTNNYRRYVPYVNVVAAIDAPSLVRGYVNLYPLFQRAYEELGFPGKYFNDRLMEAIDDLLETPELDAPVKLLRPRVLFEFADPDLETRSAGEKILLRMGPENAARVKAKLWEIRRELLAASGRR
ncbi:MAG TPA: DUF3014 domain-containing protein [Burkholderiales bacterium]|nr:DUF3014 domain-containing protein [Burkholderiales bacterium]